MKSKNYSKLNIPDWVWWTGIIESRADLTKTGRYRVRIFGWHTANTELLPVIDLPIATVLNSVTSAGTSGIMETPNLLPGSTVVGFFADGDEGQHPVIIGSIAGKPSEKNEDQTIEDGFNDPAKKYPRGGFSEPKPDGFAGAGESDISRLARDEDAETHYSLVTKRAEREKDIRTARASSVAEQLGDKENVDYEGLTWEEPYARAKGPYKTFEMEEFTPKYWDALKDLKDGGTGIPKEPGTYTSMYPFNLVRETEAGFVTEIDNTSGNERYGWYHPVGNFEEVQADGTRINKIKGSDYEIIAEDKNVLIRGSCNVTILGDAKLLVQGDRYEEIEGNLFQTVFGDRVTKIMGSDIKSVQTDQNYTIGGMRSVRVALDDDSKIVGKQTQTVGKEKKETVAGLVTEIFNENHNTIITGNRMERAGGASMKTAGQNMTLASGDTMGIRTATNMDIDAQTLLEMDAPNISIDGPVGNITSNNITLHTHTHKQTGGTAPDGDGPNDKQTFLPTDGT